MRGDAAGRIHFGVIGDDAIERAIDGIWFLQFDADGAPVKALVTCIDSSAPRRAERTLREGEARYRAALKAGRMGSWETDFVAATRTWSPEGMALFGLDLPGGRGSVGAAADEYLAAIHPDDRELAHGYRALADQQDSFPAEYRIVRRDGTVLWLAGRGLVVARGPTGARIAWSASWPTSASAGRPRRNCASSASGSSSRSRPARWASRTSIS